MNYFLIITLIGIAALGMAWVPSFKNYIRISYSLVYVLIGMIFYSLFNSLPAPDPLIHEKFTVHFTELVVIVALMGTGLKIDQAFSLKTWALPLRMVSFSMVACIGLTALLGYWLLGIDAAAAVLMAAVLAPTDPVLASDVQVGPPQEGDKENVRFSLSAEGGMNDGSAFPFVWLAIYLALQQEGGGESLWHWFAWKLIYKVAVGILMGIGLGKLLGYLIFRIPKQYRTIRISDGFAALSITLLVYGLTELIQGYGFIAVFVCAITLRAQERNDRLHVTLHSFSEQIERMLVAITLLLFGGSLVNGILLPLTWKWVLFGIIFLLILRPLTTFMVLGKEKLHWKEKMSISFFGIRGIGTFYYLSFALTMAVFNHEKEIWASCAFIVLLSIIVHGVTAKTAMQKVDEEKAKPE